MSRLSLWMSAGSLTAAILAGFTIAAQAAALSTCVAAIENEAVAAGIDRGLAARAPADVTFDEKAGRFSRTQPEYRTAIWEYMAFLVDSERIVTGQAMPKAHCSTPAGGEWVYG